MKQKAKLLPNTAQKRLTNNLRTVGLAVLAGVICGLVYNRRMRSPIRRREALRGANCIPGSRPNPRVDSKYCGSVSCGARSCQQWQ